MKRSMKAVHPGSIFMEDVLKPLGLTITDASKALMVSRKQLSEIVNEKASISAEMAVRFEQVFGASAEFWLDLQKNYDIRKVNSSGKIHLKKYRALM